MSEPVTCIKKPEPAAHTPGPWQAVPYGIGFNIKASGNGLATVAGYDQHQTAANARLIAQAPALLAHAEKSLMWLIAERDCHYECCSDPQGMVYDIEDQMTLEHYDRDIDELRALIAAAKGAA